MEFFSSKFTKYKALLHAVRAVDDGPVVEVMHPCIDLNSSQTGITNAMAKFGCTQLTVISFCN